MHWSIAVLSYLASSAFAQNSSSEHNATAPSLGPNILTAEMVSSMGNNTLFNRWRPTYHFISPAGWMNASILKDKELNIKLIFLRTHVV